ncbi:MAG: hypothetical protein ACRC41_02435 [Sarcina sp.]
MNYRFRKLILFIQLIFSFPFALACFAELYLRTNSVQAVNNNANKKMSIFLVVVFLIILSIIFDRVFALRKLSKHEDILRRLMWIFQIIISAILALGFLGSMIILATSNQIQSTANTASALPSTSGNIAVAIVLFYFISIIVENIYFYTAKKYR